MNGRLRSVKPEENLDLQSEATIAPRVHVEDLKSGNEIQSANVLQLSRSQYSHCLASSVPSAGTVD